MEQFNRSELIKHYVANGIMTAEQAAREESSPEVEKREVAKREEAPVYEDGGLFFFRLPDGSAKKIEGPRGTQGERGITGTRGTDGTDGKDGRGISNAELTADGSLVIVFSDGEKSNVGLVKGVEGPRGQAGQNGVVTSLGGVPWRSIISRNLAVAQDIAAIKEENVSLLAGASHTFTPGDTTADGYFVKYSLRGGAGLIRVGQLMMAHDGAGNASISDTWQSVGPTHLSLADYTVAVAGAEVQVTLTNGHDIDLVFNWETQEVII